MHHFQQSKWQGNTKIACHHNCCTTKNGLDLPQGCLACVTTWDNSNWFRQPRYCRNVINLSQWIQRLKVDYVERRKRLVWRGLDMELALQWRHNEHCGVSNYQPRDCLLSRLFMRRSKKTSKPRVTGLCEGNSHVTGEFPAQRDSNAEMFPFDNVMMA